MTSPKKDKKKGRFARLPSTVLQSDAVRNLSPKAFRVWVALCDQCQEWNNGTGSLCRKVITAYGLGSRAGVTAAKTELLQAGLIVQTRKAAQQRMAMFGVKHVRRNADAIEAMRIAGATWPSGAGTSGQASEPLSGFSEARHQNRSRPGIGTAEGGKGGPEARHRNRIPPISVTLEARHQGQSKSLPSGNAGETLSGDAACAALLGEIKAAHGSVTLGNGKLRLRWWQGRPPADLDARLQFHAEDLYEHLARVAA